MLLAYLVFALIRPVDVAADENAVAGKPGKGVINFENIKALEVHYGGEPGGKALFSKAPEARGNSMCISWESKHNPWVTAFITPNPPLPGLAQAQRGKINASFYATGKEEIREINLLLVDSMQERFQVHPPKGFSVKPGWNRITYEINPDMMRESYGDRRNGKIDPPLCLFGFAVDFGKGETQAGSIWIDDISEEISSLAMVSVSLETGNPLHFVKPGEESKLKLRLANRSSSAQKLHCSVEVENFAGVKSVKANDLTLDAGASQELPIVLPEGGKQGAYWLRYALSTQDSPKDTLKGELRFAILIPSGPTAGRAETFLFSICSHPERYPVEIQDLEIEAIAISGAKVLRTGPPWQEIQPAPNAKIDFSKFDHIVDTALSKGIEIQGLIAFTPFWAAKPEKQATKSFAEWGFSTPDLEALRSYCTEVAKHYKGKIRFWEIWNEPDIEFFKGTADEYLAMLKTSYKAFKAVDPAVKIMTGGFADCGAHPNSKKGFHQRILAEGQDCFDIHAYHQHGFFPDFAATVDGPLADLRKVLKTIKPLYFNETAMHSAGSSERIQAEIVVQKAVFCWSRGAIGHTWYDLRNDGTNPKDAEQTYGLITQDFYPKPAYAAYIPMTRLLSGKNFRQQFKLPAGQWAFSFGKPGDEVIVGWLCNVPGDVLVLETDAAKAEAVDIMGNPTPVPVSEGKVFYTFGNTPSYLRLTGGKNPPVLLGPFTRQLGKPLAIPGQPLEIGLEMTNPFPETRNIKLTWIPPQLLGGEKQDNTVTFSANEKRKISLKAAVPMNVPSRFGETLIGRIAYKIEGTELQGIYPVSLNMAARIPKGEFSAEPTFNLVDRANNVSLFDFDPMNQHLVWQGPQDLSARIWIAMDDKDLKVKVFVRDDIFSQKENKENFWKEDSVQMGIAVPGRKGFWEFGVAKTANDSFLIPCLAPEGFNTNSCPGSVEASQAGNEITYNISLPLAYLGLTKEQAVKGFQFNLLVNDNDGKGREGWVEIAPGIGKSKNPEAFPMVFLVDSN